MRTKFYTRRGDGGASLMGTKMLDKDSPIFHLLGGLDELNSWLGFCRAGIKDARLKNFANFIKRIQQDLFIAQAEIAAIGTGRASKIKIGQEKTAGIEKIIHGIDAVLPPIVRFIIPGASEMSARLDVARTIARKVERDIRAFSKKKKLHPELLQFTNRLSSVLFALARFASFRLKIKEESPDYK